MTQRVKPPTAQEAVLAELRRRLGLGLLRPGQAIPMEQLAEEFGVSRVPVRDGGVGLLPIDNLIGRADAVVGSWDMGIRSQPVWTWLSGFRLARFFTSVQ